MPLTLGKLLQYCDNITVLKLPATEIKPTQLKVAVGHLRELKVLDIQWNWNTQLLLLSISANLIQVTIQMPKANANKFKIYSFLYDWITRGFVPVNLKFVGQHVNVTEVLLTVWSQWNDNSPTDKTGCVRWFKSSNKSLPRSSSYSLVRQPHFHCWILVSC